MTTTDRLVPTGPDGTVLFGTRTAGMRPMSTEQIGPDDTEGLRRVVTSIARTIEGQDDRRGSSTERSLTDGPHAWAKKIVEEAYELAAAIEFEDDAQVVEEGQQLIYRVLLGVMGRGVHVRTVLAAL